MNDLLDVNWSEMPIHQAIGMAVGAASVCWEPYPDGDFKTERAASLVDLLEARVQEEVEKGCQHQDATDEVETFVDVDVKSVVVTDDGKVLNLDGLIYHLSCNEPVEMRKNEGAPNHIEATFCIKRFGHESKEHEDYYGGIR